MIYILTNIETNISSTLDSIYVDSLVETMFKDNYYSFIAWCLDNGFNIEIRSTPF